MRRRGIAVLVLSLLAGCGANPGPTTANVPGAAGPVAVDLPTASPSPRPTTGTPPSGASATVTETTTAPPVQAPPSTAPPPGATEAEPRVDTYAQIASALHGLCLDLETAGTADGVAVIQWPCGDTPQNRWGWAGGYGKDIYKIVSRHSGKCVDVADAATTEGARVVQTTCRDSGGSQLWHRMYFTTNNGWDYLRLANVRSGLCLDIPNESDEWGAQLWQYPCHSGPAQQFRTPV
jgi:hypothetical protein